jgi:hypothetical protein
MVASPGLFLFALFRSLPRRRPCGGGAIPIFVFPLRSMGSFAAIRQLGCVPQRYLIYRIDKSHLYLQLESP